MTKIFISYRRQDTRLIAGRIFDRLVARFGQDDVFMDIDDIPFGVDFHDWLDQEVGRADAVLALIGHGWADAKDEVGRQRLDNPSDFVRIEIEAALRRGVPLGAVLIDGAAMPRPEKLPECLRPLTRRNAALLDAGRDFHMHMDRLIADLERHLNGQIGVSGPLLARSEVERRRAEGRIEIDAAIVSNPHGRWFLPGEGRTEWFKDLDAGPEMVVVPAGEFLMGSPDTEAQKFGDEGPQHKVIIPRPFAVGRNAVTRGEFAVFADDSGYEMDGGAHVWTGSEWRLDPSRSWRDPGFAQDDSHPVVCVNWSDALAYVRWLRARTEKHYRLLSEAEWEYAARAGTVTPFWWASPITPDRANYNGTADAYEGGGRKGEHRRKTVPVESFLPNPWGLYQVHGNVLEWCEDCWNDNYHGAPADGSSWATGDCNRHVLRGGSWVIDPKDLRSASRSRSPAGNRNVSIGFRLARIVNP